jgi:hypothetical protein
MNGAGKMKQVMVCRFVVEKRLGDNWSLTEEIESVKSVVGPGGVFGGVGGDYYPRALSELKGARVSVTIDRQAKSLKMNFDREALFRQVVNGVFATDPLMARQVLSGDKAVGVADAKRQIEVSMDDVMAAATMTAVYLGAPLFCQPLGGLEEWERDLDLPLGPFLGVTLTGRHRFGGRKGVARKPGVALFGYRSTTSAAPNGALLTSLRTQVTRARLDEDSGDGTIEFDADAGRVSRVTSSQHLKGSLVIGTGFLSPSEYVVRQDRILSILVSTSRP